MPARTMLIALDAMDPGIVAEMVAGGDLPNLGRLLASSARARFDNEMGYFVGSVWPTITTGQPVDVHGWYTGTRFDPLTYEYFNQPVGSPALWEHLGERVSDAAVFDVPHFEVDPRLGAHVVEWGCHDRQHGTASWPEDLLGPLETAAGGPHPVGTVPGTEDPRHSPCDYLHRAGPARTQAETAEVYAALTTGVERKERASLALLEQRDWSLFVTIFGESHCAGHQLWHLHDAGAPTVPGTGELTGGPLRTVYRMLDTAVGRHIERLGPADTAYVLLSHGMQAHYDGTHLLPELLHRLGQSFLAGPDTGARSRAARAVLNRVPHWAGRAVASTLGPSVRSALRGVDGRQELDLPPLSQRAFFPLDNNTVAAAVRVNLAGREGAGVIPADLYDHALGWLKARLLELIDVDTGRPVVTRVERGDHLYRFAPEEGAADLLFEWDRRRPISRVWSPWTGLVHVEYEGQRTGDHRPAGLLLAHGPGIEPGDHSIHPTDITPIVLASLGVEADLPGHAPAALVPGDGTRPRGRRGLDLVHAAARAARPTRRSSPVATDEAIGLSQAHHVTRAMAEEASARLDLVERELGDLRRAADQGRLAAEILATSSWIRRAHVPAKLMASVVIATRDRHELLERAVESVLEQTYEHLELVVVDDAGSDESWTWLQRHPDPRLRPIRLDERAGANAARNRGRAELKGDFACYLDDDNVMDPDWLRSVAWALSEQPEVSFVYGARVIDNLSRHTRTGEASPLPWIQLLDWDAAAIREANRVDVNVLAHRLPGPLFPTEDGASHYGDWDLVLQLAEHGDPLRLPALAAYYSTAAPGRLSEDHQAMDAGWLHVREKWQHR